MITQQNHGAWVFEWTFQIDPSKTDPTQNGMMIQTQTVDRNHPKIITRCSHESIVPIPSMGLVYLPTFTIKINQMSLNLEPFDDPSFDWNFGLVLEG